MSRNPGPNPNDRSHRMAINVLEGFERTCALWPSKAAVVDKHGTWDFQTLQRRAKAIARAIANRTDATSTPIAVYLPKTREALATVLGVLYSGNCYAPLDVKAPLPRTDAILSTLEPTLVVTTSHLRDALGQTRVAPDHVLVLEDVDESGDAPVERWTRNIDTDPVYIIHTSGSTGQPKGVVISHRGVIDYIEWARDCLGITSDCTIGNQAPLVFDNSTLDLYLCFHGGATLHLLDEELFLFPPRLLQYLAAHKVDFIFWVPSVMVSAAAKDYLAQVPELDLRLVTFAGEVMPAAQLNIWRRRFPNALFANLYGPTEITVDCTYYIVSRTLEDDEPVPIGDACRNTGILILNEHNQACQQNERGELCVRGTSLAHGYWNNPAQTAASFVQNPLNPHYPETIYRTGDIVFRNDRNEIIFVGRKDFQIKHMGYRIELGDIENSVAQVSGIRNSCVLYKQQSKDIVLVYEADDEIAPAVIRGAIGKTLPKYMWPTVFHRLVGLPRNASGKIDRQLLTAEFTK